MNPRMVENPMAAPPSEIASATLIGINMLAEERLLEDMDLYSAWLVEKCYRVPASHTRFGYIPRSETSRTQFIDSLDVPQLLALTHRRDQRLTHFANTRLTDLFIKDHQDYLVRLAEEVQAEEA